MIQLCTALHAEGHAAQYLLRQNVASRGMLLSHLSSQLQAVQGHTVCIECSCKHILTWLGSLTPMGVTDTASNIGTVKVLLPRSAC